MSTSPDGPSGSHGSARRASDESTRAVPRLASTVARTSAGAESSVCSMAMERMVPSTTWVPSPQTSQRSPTHAVGVVTLTPRESPPRPASALRAESCVEKLGTRSTARPWAASASRRAPSTGAETNLSSLVLLMRSDMRASQLDLEFVPRHRSAGTGHEGWLTAPTPYRRVDRAPCDIHPARR